MGKQTDLRVIKTKRLIKDTFYEIVSEKGFEKITISDITNRASINRSTFYLHYQYKCNLLESLENGVIYEIKAIIAKIGFEQIQSRMREEKPLPHVIKILHQVADVDTVGSENVRATI
jgi:AcrR family transcriptional regulator